MSAVQAVAADATRTFTVHTTSGTDYVLDLSIEGDTLTRKPGMHRPAEGEAEGRLPGDFTPLPLVGHGDIAARHPATFTVADGDGLRQLVTAPITVIDEER